MVHSFCLTDIRQPHASSLNRHNSGCKRVAHVLGKKGERVSSLSWPESTPAAHATALGVKTLLE